MDPEVPAARSRELRDLTPIRRRKYLDVPASPQVSLTPANATTFVEVLST